MTQYKKENRKITYRRVIVEHRTEKKKKHQYNITQKKQDENAITTSKTQSENHIIQQP
jgi:hypothetical protein